MKQDEAYRCLLALFDWIIDKETANKYLQATYKTDIDYVLKAAHPETVYGALHAWAKGE